MKVQIALVSLAAVVTTGALAAFVGRPYFGSVLAKTSRAASTTVVSKTHIASKGPVPVKTATNSGMSLSTTTITTTTTPVFSGTQVQILAGNQAPSILPLDYPLSLNPVAFYQPQTYTLAFQLQAVLEGHHVILQLFQGPNSVVIATSWDHQITGTYVATGTVQLTNLSGNNAYFSILGSQHTTWLTANLITGQMTTSQVMPLAAELSPYIGGIPTLYAVPEINPGPAPSQPGSVSAPLPSSAPLIEQCLGEANTLFNTQVPLNAVVLNQEGNHLDLIHVTGGRWRVVRFRLNAEGIPIPKEVITAWQGHILTYHIGVNAQGQGVNVVLSETQIQHLTQIAKSLDYTAFDSQAGAVASLPINLTGYQSLHPGAPKLIVEKGNQTLLALTYQAPDQQHTVYLPVGWYWWQNGPQVINVPTSPSLSSSSAPSSSVPGPS
ncbi:MAG: hypothetical protein C7B47_12625 [Sulfobacillus thermosulfidooxidans]|uniref:Uncharacterized protein n=1 Tax=Sulfobacillus thermosulfidooxidans TaxID=28034 RepID=A0A2T2WSQ1_SULTH|nr:MAG: hypothetical protein C7B47_12625 [Sulfobacillus thermosulfidooxidans]